MIHIYSRNGIVDGKVEETKNKTFITYWLCPKGFYQEGQYVWLGEFDNQKQAEKCLKDYTLNREMEIELHNKFRDEEFKQSQKQNNFIICTIIFSLLLIPAIILWAALK